MEKEAITGKLDLAVRRAASKMGEIPEETGIERLQLYAEELSRWNRAYNLIGRRIGEEGMISLITDSLTPLLIKGLITEQKEILDIGSGAGLPGIPIYLFSGPFPLTLVESQRKKITFLRHTRRHLDLKQVRIYPGRFEEMAHIEDNFSKFDLVLARAVTDPMRILRQAKPVMSQGGRMVLFVGKNDAERLRKASIDLEKSAGLKIEGIRSTESIVGKEHYLVVVAKR